MVLSDIELFLLAAGAMGLGFILLVKGGNWTVDSASYVAVHFGIAPMVVGFTIVAIGTSLPELVVSLVANLQGSGGIAIGNVMGSNIANVLLVIGMTALFVTLKTTAKSVIKDLTFMLIATSVLTYLMFMGDIGRIYGAIMIAMLVGYIILQYRMSKNQEMSEEAANMEEQSYSYPLQPYVFLFIGLIAVCAGAEFLVRGAQVTAKILSVPESVIALSIIALGTSLPELSTCIIAGRKGQSEMVLGNIIGSNVFNILMILGVTALVKPIAESSYDPQLAGFDIWVVVLVSVIFALILIFLNKITRFTGLLFLAAYVVYNIYIYMA
ncbi:MAG: calcium/sodium antiporter [Alphaproteobacteria bacterium]